MLEEISAERFNYRDWAANWWSVLGLTFIDAVRTFTPNPAFDDNLRECAIGWCDGMKLRVRPRPGRAVLIYKDDEYYWFHIDKVVFDRIWGEAEDGQDRRVENYQKLPIEYDENISM